MEDAVRHFTLDRVNKAPASFDPQKLVAFQTRWMNQLDVKKKTALVLPYLQRVGWVATPPACDVAETLVATLQAAGDRVKVSGDILQFSEFLAPEELFKHDEPSVEKRIRQDPAALPLLIEFRGRLAAAPDFSAPSLEALLYEFLTEKNLKMGSLIHALRVATTGKQTGIGMFDALAILGRQRVLNRIDQLVENVRSSP
jgi:glutamyl-tRNA synthetase